MRSPSTTDQNDDDEDGIVVLLQRKLFDHYHFVAYTLIIGTYLIAFAEYAYLRSISIFLPQKIVYTRSCEKHVSRLIDFANMTVFR